MMTFEQSRFPGGPHAHLACLCAPESFISFEKAALVVAHPGHELRVFGWLSQYKPRVYVITDGSGRSGISRAPSSTALLQWVGASTGEVFGAISDVGIYRAILEADFSSFLNLADNLAASFVQHGIEFVAADAEEGYNPSHDLCRTLVNAAVSMAERATGKPIANYEFCLTEWDQDIAATHDGDCLHLRLDDNLLLQKVNTAKNYVELKKEVEAGIAKCGAEYFRIECLKKISNPVLPCQASGKPFYETWGEQRVGSGEYESVIRYKEHILPLATAIANHAAHANVNAFDAALKPAKRVAFF